MLKIKKYRRTLLRIHTYAYVCILQNYDDRELHILLFTQVRGCAFK